MAIQVSKELLTFAPLGPVWPALPGSSNFIQSSFGTGIDNVTNYAISNTGNVLSNYVTVEGYPTFQGQTLSVGVKFADQNVLPTSLTINSVTIRSVFRYSVLNLSGWHNPQHLVTDGVSSQLSGEFSSSFPLPTAYPWTTDRTSIFLVKPDGSAWDRASIFSTVFGISVLEPPADGGGGSLSLDLAALTIFIGFELPSLTPITASATSIRRTRCDFNGTIDPRGATPTYPVTCWFQYNKVGTPFATTDPITSTVVVSGDSVTAVSIRQSSLTPGARYYYRMVARNGAGDVSYGSPFTVLLPVADDVVVRF